jgi:L-2-hydroxyglutarate oxidase LhgO
VDNAAITEAMAQDVRAAGGRIRLGHAVTGIRDEPAGVRVVTAVSEDEVDRVVVCAGLQSDVLARLVGADPAPRILPFRGEYWELAPERTDLVRGMIYPVPDPRFPFLGVHFTRGVYDAVHVGPNAVPALAREGYTWSRISARDTWDSLRWPGAGALAKQHWRMGVDEVSGSLVKPLYYRKARRFVPELRMSDLARKTAAGVRAQAWGRGGELLDDFAVDQVGRVTLLRNAPSPAATSSIAIARHVIAGAGASQHLAGARVRRIGVRASEFRKNRHLGGGRGLDGAIPPEFRRSDHSASAAGSPGPGPGRTSASSRTSMRVMPSCSLTSIRGSASASVASGAVVS